MKKIAILMVCRQNICRSPLAEGLLKQQLKQSGLSRLFVVASAGTHGDMSGQRADERAKKVALNYSVKLGRHKSRQIKPKDYLKFDYILAMDRSNYQDLIEQCPLGCVAKVGLIMSFANNDKFQSVPDPYYGNLASFDQTFTLLSDAVSGLIDHLVGGMERNHSHPY